MGVTCHNETRDTSKSNLELSFIYQQISESGIASLLLLLFAFSIYTLISLRFENYVCELGSLSKESIHLSRLDGLSPTQLRNTQAIFSEKKAWKYVLNFG